MIVTSLKEIPNAGITASTVSGSIGAAGFVHESYEFIMLAVAVGAFVVGTVYKWLAHRLEKEKFEYLKLKKDAETS